MQAATPRVLQYWDLGCLAELLGVCFSKRKQNVLLCAEGAVLGACCQQVVQAGGSAGSCRIRQCKDNTWMYCPAPMDSSQARGMHSRSLSGR